MLPALFKKERLKYVLVVVVGLVTLVLVLASIQVYRDVALIDWSTGSRNGFRQWPLGWRTGAWYQQAPLEAFIHSRYPTPVRQVWMSDQVTGCTLFGEELSHERGQRGGVVEVSLETLEGYWGKASDGEKKRMGDVFASGEPGRIHALISHINETATTAKSPHPR